MNDKRNRTFPQLAAVVLLNEIIPRWRKANPKHEEPWWKGGKEMWPPAPFVFLLILLEQAERIDRKKLREFLDNYYKDLKEGKCIPWKPEWKVNKTIGYGLDKQTAGRLVEERQYSDYFDTIIYWYFDAVSKCDWKKFKEEQEKVL